jgi:hypothetical protein
MIAFTDTLLFLLATGALFFVPGWLLLKLFLKRGAVLTPLETFVLSFVVGLGLLNFGMILLGQASVRFTSLSLSLALLGLGALLALSLFIRNRISPASSETTTPHSWSKRGAVLFALLIILTVLLKTIYLSHAVLPTSTDLGHHMYWSALITKTGMLPEYAKRDIQTDASGTYSVTEPEPIADFIIGEHLPFAAISILSGIGFFTAFPIVFLLFINLLALLALVALSRALAESFAESTDSHPFFTPERIALATLLFFGPLYTLASPQAKFVSGGVVGNTLGNLFIPLIILAYLRAFREKRSDFLALGFFLTFALAYIHHLSTLITLFALGASVLVFIIWQWQKIAAIAREWLALFLQPKPLVIALLACLFFFLVAMPTYIETRAVGTALGTPTKTTRTGLSLYQVTFSSGEARVALGLAGLFLIAFLRDKYRYGSAFLIGWGGILLMMTLFPHLLFINIPSNRIGAYLSFPLGLLASFAFVFALATLRGDRKRLVLPGFAVFLFSITSFFFALGSGSYDNGQSLLAESKALSAVETFRASSYLASHAGPDDLILKDHNYIVGDAWMKLFFLRDYSYPLSRGFFKRYEDNPNREQCTLLMISVPNTARGEKCYTETGTNIVVVNPKYDVTPFEKSDNFVRIYTTDNIHIYTRGQ